MSGATRRIIIRRWLLGPLLSALAVIGCGRGGDGDEIETVTEIVGTVPPSTSPEPTDGGEQKQLDECDRRAQQAEVRYEPSRRMIIGTTER